MSRETTEDLRIFLRELVTQGGLSLGNCVTLSSESAACVVRD